MYLEGILVSHWTVCLFSSRFLRAMIPSLPFALSLASERSERVLQNERVSCLILFEHVHLRGRSLRDHERESAFGGLRKCGKTASHPRLFAHPHIERWGRCSHQSSCSLAFSIPLEIVRKGGHLSISGLWWGGLSSGENGEPIRFAKFADFRSQNHESSTALIPGLILISDSKYLYGTTEGSEFVQVS